MREYKTIPGYLKALKKLSGQSFNLADVEKDPELWRLLAGLTTEIYNEVSEIEELLKK